MANAITKLYSSESRRRTVRTFKVTFTGTYTRNANNQGGETLNLTGAGILNYTGNNIAGLFDPNWITNNAFTLRCARNLGGLQCKLNWNPTATSWANALQLMLLDTSAAGSEDTELATGYTYSATDLADYALIELEGPSRLF